MIRKIALSLSLALIFCLSITPAYAKTAPAYDKLAIQTAAGMRHFMVEIAATPAQQEHGLMERASLPKNHGMLFVFATEKQERMWMKNTPLALDMLFIDKHGRIVYIAANATPESTAIITTAKPVLAVLEIAGSEAGKKHIRVGDTVIYRSFKP